MEDELLRELALNVVRHFTFINSTRNGTAWKRVMWRTDALGGSWRDIPGDPSSIGTPLFDIIVLHEYLQQPVEVGAKIKRRMGMAELRGKNKTRN